MQIKSLIRRAISDWRVKTVGQKCLGLLPGTMSLRANDVIVDWIRGSGPDRVDFESRVNKGLSNISLIQGRLRKDLADATILEIGTGWHGIDLILFYLAGASRIYTIDRFEFLTENEFGRSVRSVSRLVKEGRPSAEHQSFLERDRVSHLEAVAREDFVSESLFDELNVQIIVAPTDRWRCVSVPEQAVDLFYSESVLQRLPTGELDEVLAASADRWLAHGGGFFHRTDQKDIHSQSHADEDRWALEYLKYPDWFFDAVLNGELMYQNRLRESDFVELFRQNGLHVDYIESLRRPEDVRRVGEMDLPPRFEGYSAEDLATRSSRFVGRLTRWEDDRDLVRKTIDPDEIVA